MAYPTLSVLIPAAGSSERLGRAKQLVKYKGRTLLQNAVEIASSLSPLEIIVVTGAHAKAVKDSLPDASVKWVDNQQWSAGMGGSIAAGATMIEPASNGLMILLCDQWRLQADDLEILADAWHTDPGRIVVSEADGQQMPPVIFPSSFFDQLRDLQGQQGARKLIKKHRELTLSLPVDNARFDLDTLAQLESWGQSQVPE